LEEQYRRRERDASGPGEIKKEERVKHQSKIPKDAQNRHARAVPKHKSAQRGEKRRRKTVSAAVTTVYDSWTGWEGRRKWRCD